MSAPFLLYGSNGYTGRLIAQHAVERGVPLILAGRNREEIEAQSAELKLPHRVVSLDNPSALDAALTDVPVVLHSAGPFSHTSRPMVDACLRTRTHYLDITGEIEVFETLAARDKEARAAGVMMLPGVGFDVVPSDCLAAHLKQRLPSATQLALAFHGIGGVSRGTATTMVENIDRGGVVRRDGRLMPVPAAWKTRQVDFGRGPVTVTTIPWGDIATAYRSTGIPNIEVYTRVPAAARRMMAVTRHLGWLLGSAPVQAVLRRMVRSGAPGPDEEARAKGLTLLWGEVEDEQGQRRVSRMRGPEGYTFTALAAVAAVEKVLAGQAPAGFQTPSLAYGADFVLEIAGVTREDVV